MPASGQRLAMCVRSVSAARSAANPCACCLLLEPTLWIWTRARRKNNKLKKKERERGREGRRERERSRESGSGEATKIHDYGFDVDEQALGEIEVVGLQHGQQSVVLVPVLVVHKLHILHNLAPPIHPPPKKDTSNLNSSFFIIFLSINRYLAVSRQLCFQIKLLAGQVHHRLEDREREVGTRGKTVKQRQRLHAALRWEKKKKKKRRQEKVRAWQEERKSRSEQCHIFCSGLFAIEHAECTSNVFL
jgi:hypothetical protein